MSPSSILRASYVVSTNAGAIVSAVPYSGGEPFPPMVVSLYPTAFLIPDSKTWCCLLVPTCSQHFQLFH